MPKMKSHSGAAKRFKKTGTGKIRRGKAGRNHMLEKKSSKHKARFLGDTDVAKADAKNIDKMLGN
ncbi:MAG: 50S ribosomal protein L35 [Acidimicrobiales bacterium]